MEKSIFNFKIQYQDGTVLDLHKDKNLWITSFHIISPTVEHTTDTIEGRPGAIYLGTSLKERKIQVKVMIESLDLYDFDLFRDELFKIFTPLEKFYIIRDLQPGKRMEVSIDGDFDIDYLSWEDGEFDINFIIHSVFLESVGTTLDPFTFDAELWQVGQGLVTDEMDYVHNTNTFQIYNAGDIVLNPRYFPMNIKYQGASSNLQIKNITTGDTWTYTGTSLAGDIIELDGIRSLKNGLSIFRDTNKKLITLAKGWNEFELIGTSDSFEIGFDFHFYYL